IPAREGITLKARPGDAEMWRVEIAKRIRFCEREWSRAKCSLNVYTLRTSPMHLHSFMPGIDVARYALLSITAPPFRTGGPKRDAPKTIKYRGDHSIWRVSGQPCQQGVRRVSTGAQEKTGRPQGPHCSHALLGIPRMPGRNIAGNPPDCR